MPAGAQSGTDHFILWDKTSLSVFPQTLGGGTVLVLQMKPQRFEHHHRFHMRLAV